MTSRLGPDELLVLWERALGQRPALRDEALLEALGGPVPAPRRLGERNARLFGLHALCFGGELALRSHCPACGSAAEFGGDCEALAAQLLPNLDEPAPHRLEAHGYAIEFRLPEAGDLDAAHLSTATATDDDAFAHALLARCVVACTRDREPVPTHGLPEAVLDAISQRMEALDPAASVSFALECPTCANGWDARLDVGQLLWQKLQDAAERVLLDVDALARAYGWTEPEVLRLSPTRRAAYLQMAAA